MCCAKQSKTDLKVFFCSLLIIRINVATDFLKIRYSSVSCMSVCLAWCVAAVPFADFYVARVKSEDGFCTLVCGNAGNKQLRRNTFAHLLYVIGLMV